MRQMPGSSARHLGGSRNWNPSGSQPGPRSWNLPRGQMTPSAGTSPSRRGAPRHGILPRRNQAGSGDPGSSRGMIEGSVEVEVHPEPDEDDPSLFPQEQETLVWSYGNREGFGEDDDTLVGVSDLEDDDEDGDDDEDEDWDEQAIQWTFGRRGSQLLQSGRPSQVNESLFKFGF